MVFPLVFYTHLKAHSMCVCAYLTCLCVRCLRRASLKVCVARSAPVPFIRWRPQERDYRERNKPAEVRDTRQKKPHIIREGRAEGTGGGRGRVTEAGEQTEVRFQTGLIEYKSSSYSQLLEVVSAVVLKLFHIKDP